MSQSPVSNPKVVLEWCKPLMCNKPGLGLTPYAYRWRLDFYWFSFRIHKWLHSDDKAAYHSHPTNMVIFILWGKYDEYRMETGTVEEGPYTIRYKIERRAPCFYTIRRDTRHFICLKKKKVWTLLFTFGKPMRWAFWDKLTLKRYSRDKWFIERGHHICDN